MSKMYKGLTARVLHEKERETALHSSVADLENNLTNMQEMEKNMTKNKNIEKNQAVLDCLDELASQGFRLFNWAFLRKGWYRGYQMPCRNMAIWRPPAGQSQRNRKNCPSKPKS